jgi:PAS domain-containing protein
MPSANKTKSIASLATFLSGVQADPEQLNQVRSFFSYLRAESTSTLRRLAWYQVLFEYAPHAYLVTDRDGVIRDANATAVEVFGIDVASLVGLNLNLLLPSEQFQFTLFEEEEGGPAARISRVQVELQLPGKPRFSFHGCISQTHAAETQELLFLWLFEAVAAAPTPVFFNRSQLNLPFDEPPLAVPLQAK